MSVSPSLSAAPTFTTLLTSATSESLRERLLALMADSKRIADPDYNPCLADTWLDRMCDRWQALQKPNSSLVSESARSEDDPTHEQPLTDWLIELFNTVFAPQNTLLVRGDYEPEYFPATLEAPAQIVFAHGFFASALHEISHWCIAGKRRRTLADYGYWYAADGRNEAQQHAFEQVEIKPQAVECLLTLACQRPFRVSQDNLFADFDTSQSTFPQDVYKQAQHYIEQPATLPRDAQRLLAVLLTVCR